MLRRSSLSHGLALVIWLVAAGSFAPATDVPNAIAVVDDAANSVLLFRVTTGDYLGVLIPSDKDGLSAPLDCQLVSSVTVNGQPHPRLLWVTDPRSNRAGLYDLVDRRQVATALAGGNPHGIARLPDGRLLIAAGAGGVRRCAANGDGAELLVSASTARGPVDAWDVLVRPAARNGAGDFLVADAAGGTILRFALNGERVGVFAQRPEFRFLEQLAARRDGRVLAADVFGDAIHEFDADGTWRRAISVLRPRGVIELRNGNLLVAGEEGVVEIDDASGAIAATKLPGLPHNAPRFLTLLRCPSDTIVGDMNGDATLNFFDIDPFVTALIDPAAFAAAHPSVDPVCAGDIDGDGWLTFTDIDPFVALLAP